MKIRQSHKSKDDLKLNEAVEDHSLGNNGGVRYKGRFMVPKGASELKNKILNETHHSKFTNHPGNTKMYHDVNCNYY